MMHLLHVLKKAYAFALFTLLLGAAGTANVFAQQTTFVDGTFKYEVNQDGTSVTVTGLDPNFTILEESLEIPSIAEDDGNTNYIVTAIGDNAFRRNLSLRQVRLPYPSNYSNYGITIGAYSFCGCENLSFVDNLDKVTSIGAYAFSNTKITRLDALFSNGHLTSIGDHAFEGCTYLEQISSLVSQYYVGIYSPYNMSSTTIGASAFAGCTSLAGHIIIPSFISSVGDNAFYGCTGLTDIVIASTPSFGSQAFGGCTNLTDVFCISTTPPTQTGGSNAFDTSIASLHVPQSYIGTYQQAAYWSDFNTINSLGDQPYTINYNSITYSLNLSTNTASIVGTTESDTYYYNLNLSCVISFLDEILSVTSISEAAFMNHTGLRSISFESGYWDGNDTQSNPMLGIGARAFKGCTNLLSVNLGYLTNLTTIGESAFEDCTSLKSLSFEDTGGSSYYTTANLTTIGNYAFKGCIALKGTLDIPSSVTTIGTQAFYGCSGLNKYIILRGTDSGMLGDQAFVGCSNVTGVISYNTTPPGHASGVTDVFGSLPTNVPLYRPAEAESAYSSADIWEDFASVYSLDDIPNAGIIYDGLVYSLDDQNMQAEVLGFASGYETTSELYIPNAVPYNGDNYYVTSIGEEAFKRNIYLTRVDLPYSYNYQTDSSLPFSIGASAFEGCTNLSWVRGNGSESWSHVVSIGDYAFKNTDIRDFQPNYKKLISIGNHAFEGCENLANIGFLMVHSNSNYDPNYTVLTTIGESAFEGCTRISGQMIIPATVTSIGAMAFYGCAGEENTDYTGITSVLFVDTPVLGSQAFDECTNLTDVYCLSTTPPRQSGPSNAFDTGTAELHVPEAALRTYENAPFWEDFYTSAIEEAPYKLYEDHVIYALNFSNRTAAVVGTTYVDNNNSSETYMLSFRAGFYLMGQVYTVTSIADKAFLNHKHLTLVSFESDFSADHNHINNQITKIGDNAFAGCTGLTSINLSYLTNLETIGKNAFSGCTNMESLSFVNPSGYNEGSYYYFTEHLTTIDNNAFKNCSSLTGSLDIPATVTKIGNQAFYGCAGLNGHIILNGVEQNGTVNLELGNEAFTGCTSILGVISNSANPPRHAGDHASSAFTGLFSKPLYVPGYDPASYQSNAYYLDQKWEPFFSPVTNVHDLSELYGNGIVDNGFIFSVDETTMEATVIGHTIDKVNYTGNLIIPSWLYYAGNIYPVTTIGDKAFMDYRLISSLEMPNPKMVLTREYDPGVSLPITIGASAFENCININWSYDEMSHVKTFGKHAFQGCTAIEQLRLDYLETICDSAFYGCTNLTYIDINGYVSPNIGAHAFDGCIRLQEIDFGDDMGDVIGSNKAVIGDYAFRNCFQILTRGDENDNIGQIDLGNLRVSSIGKRAFQNCTYLTQVHLGDWLESVGDSAFYNCTNLKYVTELDDDKKGREEESSLDLAIFQLTTIGKYAFANCGFEDDLIIGDRITSIGDNAFDGTDFEGSLYIGHGLEELPANAFVNCKGFKGDLTIGNRIETIPNSYFDEFAFTGELTLGQSVESIGTNAFDDARFSKITSFAETAPTLATGAFRSMTLSNPVYVPMCSVENYQQIWGIYGFTNINEHDYLKNYDANYSEFYFTVTDPTNKTATITNLEYGYSKVTVNDLVIPETVKGCDGEIYTVTAIGDGAFGGCAGYTGGLVIPNTVTSIGDYAFAYGGFTGRLNLPKNLTNIGVASFSYCEGFRGDLNIPMGITEVPMAAFMRTRFGGRLSLPNTLTTIGPMAFAFGKYTGDFFMPNSVTSVGMGAIVLCGFDGEMVFSNSLQSDDGFMAPGTSFTKVTLGSSMRKLNEGTFFTEEMLEGLISMTIQSVYSLATRPPQFDDDKGQKLPKELKGLFGTKGSRDESNPEHEAEWCAQENLGITLQTPVYVPCQYVQAYKEDEIWRYFNIQDEGLPRFLGTVNNLWSVSGNWCAECGTPSATNDYAIIEANCVIDENETITVGNLFVTEGCTVTVKSGAKLIAPHIFTDKGSIDGCIVVEDGGQLIHDIENVNASVQREIAAHGATISDGGWNFIASPLVTDYEPTAFNELLGNPYTYDLYYYDETAHYWRNFQDDIANVGQEMNQDPGFKLNNGQGYLYANERDATIRFNGTVTPSARPIATSLSYTEYINESANVLAGWNLVGNPFTCDATIGQSYYRIGDGANTVACLDDENIKPCEGVMVVANNSNQNVTFTRVTSSSGGRRTNCLRVNVAHTMMHRGNTKSMVEDNAIISFYEKDRLPKFVFNADVAKLYIPQDGKEYAIAVSDWQNEMPLNFKAAANGNYTISVIPDGLNLKYLHLIDNMTGDDTDLLANPSYSFDAKVSDYESRFRLVFDTDDNDDNASTETTTFAYYNGSEWVIDNTGEAILQVVDVMGRVLRNEQIDGNAHIDLGSLTPAVYMMRLVNGENVKTQKIVVK